MLQNRECVDGVDAPGGSSQVVQGEANGSASHFASGLLPTETSSEDTQIPSAASGNKLWVLLVLSMNDTKQRFNGKSKKKSSGMGWQGQKS